MEGALSAARHGVAGSRGAALRSMDNGTRSISEADIAEVGGAALLMGKNLKIEGSIKMIREGLDHTQKVYKSVYEFTNLVKQNVILEENEEKINDLVDKYFSKTSYYKQVKIEDLPTLEVTPTLFCNAVDNLVKNGLKYNKSENKEVLIFIEDNYIIVQDNGIGMTNEEFKKHIKSFSKEDKGEIGLGLNISIAILKEHGFEFECEKNEIGTNNENKN